MAVASLLLLYAPRSRTCIIGPDVILDPSKCYGLLHALARGSRRLLPSYLLPLLFLSPSSSSALNFSRVKTSVVHPLPWSCLAQHCILQQRCSNFLNRSRGCHQYQSNLTVKLRFCGSFLAKLDSPTLDILTKLVPQQQHCS